MRARWYWRRLRRMSLAEVAARTAAAGRQWRWRHPARRPDGLATLLPRPRIATVMLSRTAAVEHGSPAAMAVVAAADRLMRGEWSLFGRTVAVADEPDWFHDPLTGRDAPRTAFCFRVLHRDEAAVGNVKFAWELSAIRPPPCWPAPGGSPAATPTPSARRCICAAGGGTTRSCKACTGSAASRWGCG